MTMNKRQTLLRVSLAVYDRMIVRKKQEIMFWVLYSFWFTFLEARLFARLAPLVIDRGTLFMIRGTYVHHFVYGFGILAITGLAALNDWHHKKPRLVAIGYGIGLGWMVDEFALLIHLENVYWARLSYDAVFVVGTLLFSFVYFGRFWNRLITVSEKIIIRGLRRSLSFLGLTS